MSVTVHPSVLAHIREMLKQPFPEPSKDWARRILEDSRATYLQKRMAKEALTPRLRRAREPGDDDDEG